LPEIQRIDLQSLTGQDRPTPGWDLLSLIVEEDDLAIPRARRLIEHSATTTADPTLINFIETILVYKLPRSTREEIQTMLGISDVDLKQTRFYQDVHAEGKLEGKLEGKAEGKLEGRRSEAAEMLKRLAQLRFGALPGDVHTIIASADIAQLEEWLERLLTAPNLAAIFSDSGH
jgi:predicted transposase YdaD